jgi:ribulose 1,5-bisphosphate synthetase/thiazole synthase
MGIVIDRLLSRLLGSLPTPPITIRDEEQLLFAKRFQAREVKIRLNVVVLLPCMVRSRQTSGIGDVLAQCQSSVHVEDLVVRPSDGKLGILINKALSTVFECFDSLVVPPVGVISTLIVVSAGRIESYVTSVNLEESGRIAKKIFNIPCESSWPLTEPNAPYARYNGAAGP